MPNTGTGQRYTFFPWLYLLTSKKIINTRKHTGRGVQVPGTHGRRDHVPRYKETPPELAAFL